MEGETDLDIFKLFQRCQITSRHIMIIKVPFVFSSYLLSALYSSSACSPAFTARPNQFGLSKAADNPDAHKPAASSFSFHSRRQHLPPCTFACYKVMFKYFEWKFAPYSAVRSGCGAEFWSSSHLCFSENGRRESIINILYIYIYIYRYCCLKSVNSRRSSEKCDPLENLRARIWRNLLKHMKLFFYSFYSCLDLV